jgi:hypothetical protein
MRTFITLFIFTCASWGAVSVELPPGKTATVSHPQILSTQSFRIEGRIHNRTVVTSFSGNPMAISFTSGQNGFAVSLLPTTDRVQCHIHNAVSSTTGAPPSDFEFRVQRIVTGATAVRTCEIWDIGAAGAPSVLALSAAVTPVTIAAGTLQIGHIYADFSFAYVKMFLSALPLGSLPPGANATPGDFVNYAFEGTSAEELGDDTSGNNRDLTWSGGGVAPATMDTPPYTPVCDAGDTAIFRAGDTLTGDASGSWSRNGLPLNYVWSITEHPAGAVPTVVNNNTSSVTVGLQNTVFGQYTLGLTVSDVASTSCSVAHGSVAYTSDGIVIYPPDTPSAIKTLVGPLIAHGKNPLEWMEFATDSAADSFDSKWGTYDGAVDRIGYWDDDPQNWGGGTVDINQSDTTTGTGSANDPSWTVDCTTPGTCNFRSTVCNASGVIASAGSWTTGIFLKYPAYEGGYGTAVQGGYAAGVPISTGETGWLKALVASCPSDDQVILTGPLNFGAPKGTAITAQNWSWFVRPVTTSTPIGAWAAAAPSSVDFYDSALGFYGMYYRTGLTKYLTRARYITDRHYSNATNMNKGFPYRIGIDCGPGAIVSTTCDYADGDGQEPRDGNFTSVVVRALDGKPEYWNGLRRVCGYYENSANHSGGAGDREHGYATMFIASCALADPDPDFKARWLAELTLQINGYVNTVCTEANETAGHMRPCHGRWLGQWVLPTSNTAPGPFGLGTNAPAGQTKTNWTVTMTNGSSVATVSAPLTTPTTNIFLKPPAESVEVPVSFGPDQTLGPLCIASGAVGSMTCGTTPATTSYTSGMIIVLRPPTTITGAIAPFVNVDGLGSKAIVAYNGSASWPATIHMTAGMDWAIRYDGTRFVQLPVLSTFYPVTEPGFGFDVSNVSKVFVWPERLSSTTFRLKEYSLSADRASVPNYVWNGCDPGPTCDLDFRWDLALNLGGRVQPFMQSIIMFALDTAYEATVAAGDPDERLPPLISEAAKWMVDYAYDPLTGGLYFSRSGAGCEAASDYGEMPNTIALDALGSFKPLSGCFSDTGGARAMSAEIGRAMSKAYVREADATRKENIRLWMHKVFGKAYGKVGYDCASDYLPHCHDGSYFTALQLTYDGGAAEDKYLGFAIGFGGGPTWPAAEQHTEWPRDAPTRTAKIGFRLADAPTATGVRVTLKDQHGTVLTPVDCATSPCSVTIPDGEAGTYQFTIAYRNGSTTLVTSQWQRLKNTP